MIVFWPIVVLKRYAGGHKLRTTCLPAKAGLTIRQFYNQSSLPFLLSPSIQKRLVKIRD